MSNKKVGLTLGKYAPLHKGHQYVIDTALGEMDKVIVIAYDSPDVTDVPLQVRLNWIKHLYPQVEVIEAWEAPREVGYTKEIMSAQEQYVIQLLGNRMVSHFYSSERYGEHMSRALNAIDRRVDEQRIKHPISATKIRSNYGRYAEFLDPYVLSSLLEQT
jgi:cytidyltransferase-like protein